MNRQTSNSKIAQALPVKAAPVDLDSLRGQLDSLGLSFASEHLPAVITDAVKQDLGPTGLLDSLLAVEIERREERRVRTSLKLSGLPLGQTLANFDFAFQPRLLPHLPQRSLLHALPRLGSAFRQGPHPVPGGGPPTDHHLHPIIGRSVYHSAG